MVWDRPRSLSPDILVAGKGASSGYWPLGLCVASGTVHDTVVDGGGLVHGFTYSHSSLGCAVANAVLGRLQTGDLVRSSATMGARLVESLRSALIDEWSVGDVRGTGLFGAVELVADRATKRPFPRSERMAERVAKAARDLGLLVYPSTGGADGVNGDLLLLGPPFIINAEKIAMIVDRLASAVRGVSQR